MQGKTYLSALGAGVATAIAGSAYLVIENRVLGSLFFTVGLYMIMLNNFSLYTGKIGYLVFQEDRKMYGSYLCTVWLGNLGGTAMGAIMVRATRIGEIAEKARVIGEAKLSDSIQSVFVLAIFCGILMHVAVDGYRQTQQPVILFLCISVFILCGFEHCIANMFYFSLAGLWSMKSFIYLLVMTGGNSVGALIVSMCKSKITV